jgi:hypothetical protein
MQVDSVKQKNRDFAAEGQSTIAGTKLEGVRWGQTALLVPPDCGSMAVSPCEMETTGLPRSPPHLRPREAPIPGNPFSGSKIDETSASGSCG